MKPRRTVPHETLRLQGIASDPASSVWVSANAGSGKTHVLAQRARGEPTVRLPHAAKRGRSLT